MVMFFCAKRAKKEGITGRYVSRVVHVKKVTHVTRSNMQNTLGYIT